jgi:hypothetical protein
MQNPLADITDYADLLSEFNEQTGCDQTLFWMLPSN